MSGAGAVVYEITAEVESELFQEYGRYMIDEHVPDLMATGCFVSADISSSGQRYRIRYVAPNKADLDQYLTEHAERLRSAAIARFPAGVLLSREVWEIEETFES